MTQRDSWELEVERLARMTGRWLAAPQPDAAFVERVKTRVRDEARLLGGRSSWRIAARLIAAAATIATALLIQVPPTATGRAAHGLDASESSPSGDWVADLVRSSERLARIGDAASDEANRAPAPDLVDSADDATTEWTDAFGCLESSFETFENVFGA